MARTAMVRSPVNRSRVGAAQTRLFEAAQGSPIKTILRGLVTRMQQRHPETNTVDAFYIGYRR